MLWCWKKSEKNCYNPERGLFCQRFFDETKWLSVSVSNATVLSCFSAVAVWNSMTTMKNNSSRRMPIVLATFNRDSFCSIFTNETEKPFFFSSSSEDFKHRKSEIKITSEIKTFARFIVFASQFRSQLTCTLYQRIGLARQIYICSATLVS